MLKPEVREFEFLDFIPQGAIGTGGVVVLQEITSISPDLTLEYHFTDIYLLRAIQWGIVNRQASVAKSSILALAEKLAKASLGEKVRVTKSMFAKAKSPNHLLALLSFHSPLDIATPFRHQVVEYGKHKFYSKDQAQVKAYERQIREQLLTCCQNLK